jgi:hypothetical protein
MYYIERERERDTEREREKKRQKEHTLVPFGISRSASLCCAAIIYHVVPIEKGSTDFRLPTYIYIYCFFFFLSRHILDVEYELSQFY